MCDRCGLCCLVKAEVEDTGEVLATNAVCKLLDCKTCECTNYPNRKQKVPDCITLTPDTVGDYQWLPKSCGYRRVHEGRGLAWWHPLISGSPQTVHDAGVSVQGEVISETDIDEDNIMDHLAPWLDVDRSGD